MSDEWQTISQIVYGTVNKVQTLAAGGFRVTIDGIAPELAQAAFLMPFADAPGVTLRVTFERLVEKKNEGDPYGL